MLNRDTRVLYDLRRQRVGRAKPAATFTFFGHAQGEPYNRDDFEFDARHLLSEGLSEEFRHRLADFRIQVDVEIREIFKPRGLDFADVKVIVDTGVGEFYSEFVATTTPTVRHFNDKFLQMITRVIEKINHYAHVPKPHEPGVRRLDDEVLGLVTDVLNKGRAAAWRGNMVLKAAELQGENIGLKDPRVPIRFLYEQTKYVLDKNTRILYDLQGNRVGRAKVVPLEVDSPGFSADHEDFEFDAGHPKENPMQAVMRPGRSRFD